MNRTNLKSQVATLAAAILVSALAVAPTVSQAQANGISLNLDEQSSFSKWGRWTYFDQYGSGYGLKIQQDRAKIPLTANWRQGDWVFKLNKDLNSEQHDLFFGLRISEDKLQTTSLGCMSKNKKNESFSKSMCGLTLDVNLR